MPDAWEQANGTFVFIPDANDDPDSDGLTNWEEYLAGTHPNNASSALRFTQITAQGGNVILQFLATSNRTYSLLYKPSLGELQWSKLADVSAHPTNRMVTLTNNVPGDASRFYRLVTPAQANGFIGSLRMEQMYVSAGVVTVGFTAISNRSYTVQYNSSLSGAGWSKLKDVPASPTNRSASVTDSTNGVAARFYRLVTPTEL